MRCPACRAENRDGVRFCEECGGRLDLVCPRCGVAILPDKRFCGSCGAPLAEPTPPSREGFPDAERRQLSVMFCDLVESTRLSSDLDPEDLRHALRAYQAACAEVVTRYDGHVAQYLGDGILAYFGFPRAHDDDARRAVQAALGIVQAMAELGERSSSTVPAPLAVRVAVHTGLVVVGEVGGGMKTEHLALGEAPNIAARLQSVAEPGAVVISAATYHLVQRHFLCRERGVHQVKGLAVPLRAYEVVGEADRQRGVEVPAQVTGSLVGRAQELGLLVDRWEQVTEGHGQAALLTGEPGIGKSRLLHAAVEHLAGAPHVRLEGRCSPYYTHTPLYPIVDLLHRLATWAWDDSPDERLRKLEAVLAAWAMPLPETLPVMASLLSLSLPERYAGLALSPERLKQRTMEAVIHLLLAMGAEQPVVLLLEDLHWSDPSTIELLTALLDQVPTARLLLLLAARPEFRPPWPPRSHLTHITLNRLNRKHTEALVQQVAGGKPLPAALAQQIVAKTDGVPLFVEELTKTVLESGALDAREDRYELTGPLPALAIPTTLQGSLMARLDRLAAVKEVAQLGATLGRAFPYEVLRAVSPMEESALQSALHRLVQAELLHQRGLPPHAVFVFKHALIQDAAYQSLLKATRQQYHQRIARALVEQFPDIGHTQHELVAHHFTEAGLNEVAIPYWHRAGQRAIERSANLEAIDHLTRGLQALGALPETPARLQQELDLQTALGPALMATKGFGAPEVASAYARARELCRRLGDTPQLFAVLRGLWEYYELRAEAHSGREVAEQLLALAQRANDRTLLVVAHDVMGDTSLWLGEFSATREHMQAGMALYDPHEHRSLAFLYGGYDPGMACRCFGGHALWYLGYPDQALQRNEQARALARTLGQPATLVFALSHAAVLHQFRGEALLAQQRAEEAIALSDEQGFAFWRAHATIPLGWALAAQGRVENGITLLLEGLAGYRATGAELERSLWVALLAEAYLAAARPDDALAAVTDALADVARSGISFHEAELHRLQGEALLRSAGEPSVEAEACFRRAIDVARRQQAKSPELRAVMSLARHRRRAGKPTDEVAGDLRRLLAWFTEGAGARDLRDGRRLLEQLGG